MRARGDITLFGLIATMVAGVIVPGSAAPSLASKNGPTDLPFSELFEIEIDEARQQIFVSAGLGSEQIAVIDFDGNIIATIPVPKAAGLELVGSTLYIGQRSYLQDTQPASIYVVDAVELRISDSLPLGTRMNGRLAYANGKLWYSNDSLGSWGDLAAVDVTSGEVWTSNFTNAYSLYDPAFENLGNNELLVADDHHSWVYSLADLPPMVSREGPPFGSGYRPRVIDNEALLAYDHGVNEYDLHKMALTDTHYGYVDGKRASGPLAVSEELIAASTSGENMTGTTIDIYSRASGERSVRFSTDLLPGGPYGDVYAAEFDPRGGRLFSFVRHYVDDPMRLVILDLSMRDSSLEMIASSRFIDYGESVTVTATLGVEPDMTNTSVTIYKDWGCYLISSCDHSTNVAAAGPVDANGELEIALTPDRITYPWVKYEGDETYLPDVAATEVLVRLVVRLKLARYYARGTRYHLYHAGSRVRARSTFAPVRPNSMPPWKTQRYQDGVWHPQDPVMACVDKGGSVRCSWRQARGRYRVRAVAQNFPDHALGKSKWQYYRITS
jgi:hypothetical protein